ncbi:oxidative stress survival, Svf1-like protein [Scheffersomyces amazonensis]|uniref:oxidative stress survival, Svf1-like protein n=1 Tax=Scheffersomyces amazonensis TaxID=1078765 RepID=UPI00315CAAD7
MLKWVQSGLSAVAGTAEPEYGREAIYTVIDSINQEHLPVFRETTIEDFNWQSPNYTNVETQTFYFTDLSKGHTGFAQVIHSNVMGVHTTAQFTFRLFNTKDEKEVIWSSTKLDNFEYKGSNFYADNLSIEFISDSEVEIKSSVNPESIVDFKITRAVPGVIFGKDGSTLYGEDKENPWGSMRHLFWPRSNVVGTVKSSSEDTEQVLYDINGYSMFVMALQGMKPHHAAKAWNFMNFHSSNYSAVTMEFTTPPSYANTKVNIGIISSKDKILFATVGNHVIHKDSEVDEIGWSVPKSIEFNYVESNEEDEDEDEDIVASVKGNLSTLVERVDVMAEIPQFVKNIVSGVAGTKPYIYQYCNEFDITVKESKIHSIENDVTESGIGFTEVTFISE